MSRKRFVTAALAATLLAATPTASVFATNAVDYDPTDVVDKTPNYTPELDESLYGEDGGSGQTSGGTTTPSPGTQPADPAKPGSSTVPGKETTKPGDTATPPKAGGTPTVPAKDGTKPSTGGTENAGTPGATTKPDGAAADGTEQGGVKPGEVKPGETPAADPTTGTSTEGKELPILDKTDVRQDGLYVNLTVGKLKADMPAPYMRWELWNATTNKKLSTLVAHTSNFTRDDSTYHLKFDTPGGYKKDDQFALILRDKDEAVKDVVFSIYGTKGPGMGYANYTTNGKEYIPIQTVGMRYDSDKNIVETLYGTQGLPITAGVNLDTTSAIIRVLDGDGLRLSGMTLKIQRTRENPGTFTVTTDREGYAKIPLNKLTQNFLVSADGRKVIGASDPEYLLSLPFGTDTPELAEPAYYELRMQPYKEVDATAVSTNGASGNPNAVVTNAQASVTFNVSGNTDLSKNWVRATLSVTDKAGKEQLFDVTKEDNVLYGLANGTYSIKAVDNGVTNVTLGSSTLNVSGGKGVVTVNVTPKYTMSVDKDGAEYTFSVVNVAEKKYAGKSATVFGVSPGESYMVKDEATGDALNAIIDEGSYNTHVILGVGVVAGGTASAASPHTGDALVYWLGIAAVSGGALAYLLFRRKKEQKEPAANLTTK